MDFDIRTDLVTWQYLNLPVRLHLCTIPYSGHNSTCSYAGKYNETNYRIVSYATCKMLENLVVSHQSRDNIYMALGVKCAYVLRGHVFWTAFWLWLMVCSECRSAVFFSGLPSFFHPPDAKLVQTSIADQPRWTVHRNSYWISPVIHSMRVGCRLLHGLQLFCGLIDESTSLHSQSVM